MQFFYKIFLGFIVILFIVFGSLVILRSVNSDWVDEEYPVLTEDVVASLERGEDSWMFDREQVLFNYLSEKFPQKEAKILREKDLDHQFLYAVDIEGFSFKLRLQKRKLENISMPVWTVKQIQQEL